MSKNINPEVLGGLDWERQFAQTHSFGGQKRRVQLDRGESWLIRFLPVALGESKRFYARIARHWQDKRQIVCPRLTEPAFGGNVEAYCPVCNVAEEINADKNEEISKAGYKLSAQMQWLTYCAVFEKTAKGGEPRGEPMNEVLLPYEFNHYKGTWDELCAFIAQNKKRTPLSVLDYMLGNDFYVTRGKNIRLDKQDAAPIFDSNDPKFDEYVSKLEANCKDPVVKVPTDKQLEDFAAKAEEAILSSGRPGGRTARFNPDDEREPDADAEGHEGTTTSRPHGAALRPRTLLHGGQHPPQRLPPRPGQPHLLVPPLLPPLLREQPHRPAPPLLPLLPLVVPPRHRLPIQSLNSSPKVICHLKVRVTCHLKVSCPLKAICLTRANSHPKASCHLKISSRNPSQSQRRPLVVPHLPLPLRHEQQPQRLRARLPLPLPGPRPPHPQLPLVGQLRLPRPLPGPRPQLPLPCAALHLPLPPRDEPTARPLRRRTSIQRKTSQRKARTKRRPSRWKGTESRPRRLFSKKALPPWATACATA
jgi:hypothetical protein